MPRRLSIRFANDDEALTGVHEHVVYRQIADFGIASCTISSIDRRGRSAMSFILRAIVRGGAPAMILLIGGCGADDDSPKRLRLSLNQPPSLTSMEVLDDSSSGSVETDVLVMLGRDGKDVEVLADRVDVRPTYSGTEVGNIRVWLAPMPRSKAEAEAERLVVALPFPDGSLEHFKKWSAEASNDKLIVSSDMSQGAYSITVSRNPTDRSQWHILISVTWELMDTAEQKSL